MSEERCLFCGEIIPEGRQICIRCEAWLDMPFHLVTAEEFQKELRREEEAKNDQTK